MGRPTEARKEHPRTEDKVQVINSHPTVRAQLPEWAKPENGDEKITATTQMARRLGLAAKTR